MKTERFDCIITGAGPAGAVLARKLAEAGLKTVLLEQKKLAFIGYPWEVAIEKSVFGRSSIRFPDVHLWEEGPDVARYFSDDPSIFIQVDSVDDDGFFIRHNVFNKYLLDYTRKAGALIRDQHRVNHLVIKDDFAVGLKGCSKTVFGSRPFYYEGKMIIDATGIDAVLRKQTPDFFMIKRSIQREDFAYGWNEVREVSDKQVEKIFEIFNLTPGMSYTKIGQHRAYEVMHLRKNNRVNLIFGAAFQKDGRSARTFCDEFLKKHKVFGSRMYGGGNLIPIRRSINSMVANGFLCIGDTACQVIPTMGSGVASSMHAADMAARVIVEAFNRNNFSREQLWSYNHKYQTKRGAILAGYDVFRRFLQTVDTKDITAIIKAGLVTNENFINTFTSNTIKYNIFGILENIVKIFSHLNLLPTGIRFVQAARDSQRALNLYKGYPESSFIDEFKRWEKSVNELFVHY